MAVMTGQIEQGNCEVLHFTDGVMECMPVVPDFYRENGPLLNGWHSWHALLRGRVGEELTVRVHWPRAERPQDDSTALLSWGIDTWKPKCMHDFASFFFYYSYDHIQWRKIEGIRVEGDVIVFNLKLEKEKCWLSSSFLYTVDRYQKLLDDVKDHPFCCVEELCQSLYGDPVYLFRITNPSAAGPKQHIHLQAALHCGETTACTLLDEVVRYLLSSLPETEELLKHFVFHIIPVVDVGGWRQGRQHIGFNMNRDWGEFTSSVTAGVWRYMKALLDRGEALNTAIDFHGGWPDITSPAEIPSWAGIPIHCDERVERIAAAVGSALCSTECGFLAPNHTVTKEEQNPAMAQGFWCTQGIPALTVEVSFAVAYDPDKGCQAQLSQQLLQKAAARIPHAICTALEQQI